MDGVEIEVVPDEDGTAVVSITTTDHDAVVYLNGRLLWRKVTREEALEIRQLYRDEVMTQRQLARRFGISQQAISKIVRGETW